MVFLDIIIPLVWPISNAASALKDRDLKKQDVPKLETHGKLNLVEHLSSMAGALRSFAMAWWLIYHVSPQPYPAFGAAAEWRIEWMWPLLVRNLLACWLICGVWDYTLYFSPLSKALHKYKMNPKYPSSKEILRDAFWSTTAMFTWWGLEVVLCHLWASGKIAYQANIMETPIQNCFWALLITHWRIPHFYLIHRGMHPWKTENVPDIGKFLYRKVHSLHHKSYNPTAFSGTNMHPVESLLYFSACLIAVAFHCHPSIVVGCIVDCAVGAWLGHDGFQYPGGGDYFHQLHHAHFDCNYGAEHVPIDRFFGTFLGEKKDLRKIWGKKDT